MNPRMLIDPIETGVPAPDWFVQFFKVLGFTLHAVPMSLWYAGIILAMLLHASGNAHGRRFASRLMGQMPLIIAYGVNLGIVPLLFVQLAYNRVFYPATILMAWAWMTIIVLLIPAYYGVYYYASGLSDGAKPTRFRVVVGWTVAGLFLVIGFLFANGFSLMANVEGWPGLFDKTNVAGAPTGTALNIADVSLWPRWLLMFGLAVQTTAVWMVVDAAWFARAEEEAYRRWAGRFAWKIAAVGLLWFVATGAWYVFGTWHDDVRATMLHGPLVILTVLTAIAPGIVWLALFTTGRRSVEIARSTATWIALVQVISLALNAVSRQFVQNLELAPYFNVFAQTDTTQWSPLIAFLLAFVAGVGVLAWMLAQAIRSRGTCQGSGVNGS